MKRKRSFLCFFITALLLWGCADEVENRYTSIPAYFVYKNTNTVPQLNAALNNMGEFATIVLDRNYYYFTNLTGTTQVNKTALNNYSSFRMGLSGFIVGLPNIQEPDMDVSVVTCYDLACPNCYRAYSITRSLKLLEAGYASCSSCQRTYNLNNQGLVAKGDAGISLFRYRVSHANYVLAIVNQ